MHYMIFLVCIVALLGGCKSAKEYVAPTIDSHLKYSPSQVADKDGKGVEFKIPGHVVPLVQKSGAWNEKNVSSMVWLDGDRVVFVRDIQKIEQIQFLNVVSGEVYPCEDEIQRQEVLDAMATHELKWFRTTERDLTGSGQLVKRMLTTGACDPYDEYMSAEVRSPDEKESVFIVHVQKYAGFEVQDFRTKEYECEYRKTHDYCGLLPSRVSTTPTKIGLCPEEWATLTDDGKYMLTDAGLLDVEGKGYLTKGALVQQDLSTPPVLLAHTVSPSFDHVAILYGYPDHYVVDVVPLTMPKK